MPRMTDAERLQLVLDVAKDERWVDRAQEERKPRSRARFLKRLHDFIDSESLIDVGEINMSPREWTPRLRYDPELRTDLADNEIEQIRLEELRFLLSNMLRGAVSQPIAINIGVEDGSLKISGAFPDVVLYLAMRLLADSGLEIKECEAPEAGEPGRPNAYDRLCGGLYIEQRTGCGRYCSKACRKRAHAKANRA